MADSDNDKGPNWLVRLWRWFWSPTGRFSWGAIFVAGGLAGILFWGGFNTFMEFSNTQTFCTSCHEMRDFVYAEYKGSVHDKNPTGVRAICSDCHVPKEWVPKLIRKVRATNELFHKMLGTISTREKFEAARLDLASNVWRTMKANDSHECRNCHSFAAMDIEKQPRRAQRFHREAPANNETCIDCHQGISHKLPDGWEDAYDKAIGR
ncbi:MAG: NapC/NirT family cytochrome c [Rhodospirillales bacterium]